MSRTNDQWTVAAHPTTVLALEHFARREVPVPTLAEGEFLIETHALNIAPVMRMYMMGNSAAGEAPLRIGDVIHGRGVGQVIESRHPDYAEGIYVQGQLGWQRFKISRGTAQEKLRILKANGLPITYALSALGMTGYSAWCGFFSRGEPKPGEALLVSGAVGGVGSLVVQMARIIGMTPIIGIAGGPEKCALARELGCDDAIDYRSEPIHERLTTLLPDGFKVFFDNVGGEILNTALLHLAPHARVVLCGAISEYEKETRTGPANYFELSNKNADFRGFFVYHHQHEFDQAETQMAQWLRDGQLRVLTDTLEGFERMPEALMGMYTGTGGGKRLVTVKDGPVAVY
ncbi:MAG: NADP-dependent oxidoreductase [Pseudomonadota bacterium]